MRTSLARWLLWVTPALWSSNYIIARAADGVLTAHSLALGRWTVGLLLMLPGVWGSRTAMARAFRVEWRRMLVLGGLGMWICGAFVYLGGHSTSATNIGLIYATTPVGIAAVGAWALHEPVSRRQRAAMVLALLGVVLVVAHGDLTRLAAARFTAGDLWIVAAALSWVAYSVLLRRWPSQLGPRERLFCITLGGLAVLVPFTLLEVSIVPVPAFTPKALLLVGLAGLIPGFLSYQAYSWLIQEVGVSRAGVIMYLSPIYAALLAWAVLGEPPRWYHAVGAMLILPSIWLASRGRAGGA